jgi:hypothetical protein
MRFYIVDTTDGTVRGTDDEKIAKEYAESEEFFVIDSKTDKWLMSGGSSQKLCSV